MGMGGPDAGGFGAANVRAGGQVRRRGLRSNVRPCGGSLRRGSSRGGEETSGVTGAYERAMTEQPNEPGRDGPEGPVPPYAVLPLVAAPPQAPAEQAPDTGERYSNGVGFALWCCGFLGAAGIHRFYLGMYFTGILWLLTLGFVGIGQFFDLFRMKRLVRKANIRDGYMPHPRLAPPAQPSAAPRKLAKADTREQTLLKAAQANGGLLTVTQGVLATGLGFEEVEEALREMVVKGHVDVDNAADSGVIVYRFPGLTGPFK